jgi:phosphate starvation-inducible PhoH-like protein
MTRKRQRDVATPIQVAREFHLDFLHPAQELAYRQYERHDLLFLLGPAGTGKSHLATGFAIQDLLQKKKERIVITRPIVEAGESLGFLPGEFSEKVAPYMMPIYDCITKIVGKDGSSAERIRSSLEVVPLAYMRGRSQPLDSLVVTPTGYRRMGDIKRGDYVTGTDGSPTQVWGVYPQGTIDVYKVTFSDGTSAECSEDHLWDTMTLNEKRHNKGYTTKTTKQIQETVKNKYNQKVHRIQVCSPVSFSGSIEGIDPYILGALLGDGNFHEQTSVTLTNVDNGIVEEVRSRLPSELRLVLVDKNQYRLVGHKHKPNSIRRFLKRNGLLGKTAGCKFIPESCKIVCIVDRLELLRGLMDTDGSIFKHRSGNCRIQYYSTSKKLAKDVVYLVNSLGGIAHMRKREFDESDDHMHNGRKIRHTMPCYVVDIVIGVNPFKIERKAQEYNIMRPQRLIASVQYVGRKPCQCIAIDAKNSLYLTDHFIVTHNTFDNAVFILDEAQNCTYDQLKLAITRLGMNSKMIITADPEQSDLGGPTVAVDDVVAKISSLSGIGVMRFREADIVRHSLIAKILKKL